MIPDYQSMSDAEKHFHSLVQFKLLHENSVPPTRGTDFSGAFDIYVPEGGSLWPGEKATIGTGLAHRIHPGYTVAMRVNGPEGQQTHKTIDVPFCLQGLLFGRSGLAAKHNIRPFFAPCLIDADYRGEIVVVLENAGETAFKWDAGDRLCQIMYLPTYMGAITVTDYLPPSQRGVGGFGSTGGVSHGQ